jgi:transcriptional regulator with XRE-family HTH domain
MTFGEKLKEIRLNVKKIGLSAFAKEIGMSPSEYSDIEKGYAPPPSDEKWIKNIMFILAGNKDIKNRAALYYYWREPFQMQKMPEDFIPGVFLHHSDGSQFTQEQLDSFVEFMEQRIKEHNKKADEFNKNVSKK